MDEHPDLAEQLDAAWCLAIDRANNYWLAWFGPASTGVHVYNDQGREVSYWQLDQPGPVSREAVYASMRQHIRECYYP